MIYNGTEYEPWKDGKFRCPWKCGNPDYPQAKWATEKGFLKHLEGCPENPAIGANYIAELESAPEVFAKCPDCGREIMKITSIWQMEGRFVCYECREPYQEAGIGYLDSAGLVLPKFLLEG
jgi:predicted RNA-binding Zn-ribbon protein involved in translation (DUF1610 family)